MFIQNMGCVVRHGPCRFHLSDKTKGSDRNLPLPSNGAKLHILIQPSNVGGNLESANVFAKPVIVVIAVCHSYDRRLSKADRL